MVRVCERALGSRDDAEDCASEALLQAFSEGLDDVENVEAWLVTLAKRRATDMLRRRARSRRQLIRLAARCEVSDPDHAERVADEAEARWLSDRADELLTPPARAVLRVVADGGSVNDAAHRLAMTRRSAESHLHRARLTLRAARLAVPAFVVAFARAVRRPVAASSVASVALVAGVAVIAPAYLTPAEQITSRDVDVAPVVSEVMPVAPEAGKSGQATPAAPVTRTAKGGRVERATVARTTVKPPREMARIPTSAGLVIVSSEDRGGATATVTTVTECVERLVVLGETIGC